MKGLTKMFKANRKITQSIELCEHDIKFKEFDMVYLEKGAVTYVTKELKPELVRIELTTDQYELLVKSSTEIETYDYDRSKVARNRSSFNFAIKKEKSEKTKESQEYVPKRKTEKTNYYDDVYPYLDYIKQLKEKKTTQGEIAKTLNIHVCTLSRYTEKYPELRKVMSL